MNTCQAYQAQLLDHLYGLLDPQDQAALSAHLEGCPSCRAALDATRAQQQAIAYAARGQFPGVRFVPPAEPAVARDGAHAEAPPGVLPAARRRWGRWAVAAGIVALVGLGGAAGMRWYEHADEASRALQDHERARQAQARIAQARQRDQQNSQAEIAEIQEQIRLLEAQWTGEAEQVRGRFADQDVRVTVTGPKTVQAGAPNVYRIDARRQRPGAPAMPAKLTARILDPKAGRELARLPIKEGATRW